MLLGRFGDKKLRAIGVRTGVRHRQPAGDIEIEIRVDLIRKHVPGISAAGGGGIAPLDHESGNHPVKRSAVVERLIMHRNFADRIGPIFAAFSQTDEICNRVRCLRRKELASDAAHAGIENSGGTRGLDWNGIRLSGGSVGQFRIRLGRRGLLLRKSDARGQQAQGKCMNKNLHSPNRNYIVFSADRRPTVGKPEKTAAISPGAVMLGIPL